MSTQTRYPYRDGDVLVLGPEIFVSSDGEVICWQGVNYVPKAEAERLRESQAILTSVRVWAEIVEERHSDERVQRFARMLLGLLDGDAPDITAREDQP